MKKILKGFIIYYGLGFILVNAFMVSRHSSAIFEAGPIIIMQNITSPLFWGWTLVWPLYLGLYIDSFITGNFTH